MKKALVMFLLLPAAAFSLLLLAGVMALVLSIAPPAVSAASLAVLALAALWFFVFRRSTAGPVSELSLMGRQTSKDGLL